MAAGAFRRAGPRVFCAAAGIQRRSALGGRRPGRGRRVGPVQHGQQCQTQQIPVGGKPWAHLPPQIAPLGGVIPHAPAQQPVAQKADGQLKPGDEARPGQAAKGQRPPGQAAVQRLQGQKAQPARTQHGPVGTAAVQAFQPAVPRGPQAERNEGFVAKQRPQSSFPGVMQGPD